jgi:hypothetical protein
MLKQMATTDRTRSRANRVPRVSELEVWRTATQLMKQHPETSWLVAAERADGAYAAGQMSNFRLWARVTQALTELLRKRTSGDTMN